MNFSKQSVLGAVMFLGGSAMLYATVKPDSSEQVQQIETIGDDKDVTLTVAGTDTLSVEPLTTDIKTETDFLEKKQQEREALVKEQEEKAKMFIEEQEDKTKNLIQEQEQASDVEISETNEENPNIKEVKAEVDEKGVSRPQVASRKVEDVTTHEEILEADKSETSALDEGGVIYHVRSGEGLIQIARDNDVPLEVLAEANDMYFLDSLMYGQKLIIPSAVQVAKLEISAKNDQNKRAVAIRKKRAQQAAKKRIEKAKLAKARLKKKQAQEEAKAQVAKKKANAKKKAEQQAKREAAAKAKAKSDEKAKKRALARKKATEAKKSTKKRSTPKNNDQAPRGTFGVQIALASDQENADAIATKLRKAGYKTKTSQTDKGVRVMVGPVKGKPAALKLRNKINKDTKTGVKNSWVLYWR